MDIGKPKRVWEVEPVETPTRRPPAPDPSPAERPVEPAPNRDPAPVPAKQRD